MKISKGEFILAISPLLLAIIFSLIAFFTKIWLFAVFNLLPIGLSFMFFSIFLDTKSTPLLISISFIILILASGLLLFSISKEISETISVDATVISCHWSGFDDEMNDEYNSECIYEVDGKQYSTGIITNEEVQIGEVYKIDVSKRDPGTTFTFGYIGGYIAGVIYIAIGIFFLTITIKNKLKRMKSA